MPSAIPAVNIQAGNIVQVVNFQDGAVATGSTSIPDDNTIPQNTEGNEYMTLAITPTSATNKLKIDVVFCADDTGTSKAQIFVALFQDATSDALAAAAYGTDLNATHSDGRAVIAFTHYMTSGTTSSTTFKVRAAPGSGSSALTFNGQNSAGRFGGVMASSITITEIQA